MSVPSKESVMATTSTVSPQPATPVASPTVNESVMPMLVDLVHVGDNNNNNNNNGDGGRNNEVNLRGKYNKFSFLSFLNFS